MKNIFKWSNILKLLEYVVYVCPTLGTVMYYYFTNIRAEVSTSSQYSFSLALVLFVLFIVFKAVTKKNIEELRQGTVQTETDYKNTPETEADRRALLLSNATASRKKLTVYDNGALVLGLLIFALGVNILERAMIGLTNLALIAVASVAGGLGLEIGVLQLKKSGK